MSFTRKLITKIFRFSLLSSLTTTALLVSSPNSQEILAQEYSGCFMINSSGSYMNLSHLCTTKEEVVENPIIMDGIMVNNLDLIREGDNYYIEGLIKNITTEPKEVKMINVQIEDIDTNVVLGNSLVNVNSILSPQQSRSVRDLVEVQNIIPGIESKNIRLLFVSLS